MCTVGGMCGTDLRESENGVLRVGRVGLIWRVRRMY